MWQPNITAWEPMKQYLHMLDNLNKHKQLNINLTGQSKHTLVHRNHCDMQHYLCYTVSLPIAVNNKFRVSILNPNAIIWFNTALIVGNFQFNNGFSNYITVTLQFSKLNPKSIRFHVRV